MLMLKSVSSKEFDLPKQLQVLWRREIQSVCVCLCGSAHAEVCKRASEVCGIVYREYLCAKACPLWSTVSIPESAQMFSRNINANNLM